VFFPTNDARPRPPLLAPAEPRVDPDPLLHSPLERETCRRRRLLAVLRRYDPGPLADVDVERRGDGTLVLVPLRPPLTGSLTCTGMLVAADGWALAAALDLVSAREGAAASSPLIAAMLVGQCWR
jgi:hypothetical protein